MCGRPTRCSCSRSSLALRRAPATRERVVQLFEVAARVPPLLEGSGLHRVDLAQVLQQGKVLSLLGLWAAGLIRRWNLRLARLVLGEFFAHRTVCAAAVADLSEHRVHGLAQRAFLGEPLADHFRET